MKGYTLIELLGVIVLIAVIVTISVPIIGLVIDGVKKSTFKVSAANISRTAGYLYSDEAYEYKKEFVFTFIDGELLSNYKDLSLDIDGDSPQSGTVVVTTSGDVALALFNGEYCAVKDYTDSEVTITNDTEETCKLDILLPQIHLNGGNPMYVEINTPYTEEGATATDTSGNPIDEIDIEIREDNKEVPILNTALFSTYNIFYTAEEIGKTNYVTREVIITDTNQPVITVPLNTVVTIAELNTFDIMAGVSATDNSGESIEVISYGSLARVPGSYIITYTATDSSGNLATVDRVIDVIDTDGPVITLNGASIIELLPGNTYTELGATALDEIDGDLTSSIVTSGTVNTSTIGTYYITYKVSDNSLNESSITREVRVIDNIPPTVAFGTNGNSTYAKTRSTTVTVSDIHSVVANRYYMWTTSTTAPSSASFTTTFSNGATLSTPAGVTGGYYLWIKAVDGALNETITRSNVFNLDNTAPVITVTNPTVNITLTTAGFTDSGVTASDNINGNLTSSITSTNNINTRLAGTYTINYSVTDSSGNVKTATKTVIVNGYTEYRYKDYTCSYYSCTSTTSPSSYSCPSGSYEAGGVCRVESNFTYYVNYTAACLSNKYSLSYISTTGQQSCPSSHPNLSYIPSQTGGSCPSSGSYCTTGRTCSETWSLPCYYAVSKVANCPSPYSWNGSTCAYSTTCSDCAWGGWSLWSTTVYTASGTRQVETRLVTSI